MVSSSPILDLFAEELKISREAAGLSQQQLAEAIRYSSALVGKVEQRDRRPNPDFAARCDTLFETNGLFGRIQRRLGRRDAFVVWLREWVAVEQEAVALRGYEPLYVPGLLQAEEYARAVLTGSRLLAKSAVEQQVTARMGRQEILARDEPPRLSVILDHAVLTRPVGGPAVMRGQLEHLVRLGGALPLLKIHVVPAAIGAYAGLDGGLRHRHPRLRRRTGLCGGTVPRPDLRPAGGRAGRRPGVGVDPRRGAVPPAVPGADRRGGPDMELTGARWRTSTRSNSNGGNCVEVAGNLPGVVGVRDSKDRGGPLLTFTPDAWRAFVTDLPVPLPAPQAH